MAITRLIALNLSLIHISYDRYGDKEYVEHVLRYYQITASGGSYPANGMQIPHYLQTDYGNIPYAVVPSPAADAVRQALL